MTHTPQEKVTSAVRHFMSGIPPVRRGLDPDTVKQRVSQLVVELLIAEADRDVARDEADRAKEVLRDWQSKLFNDRQGALDERPSKIIDGR